MVEWSWRELTSSCLSARPDQPGTSHVFIRSTANRAFQLDSDGLSLHFPKCLKGYAGIYETYLGHWRIKVPRIGWLMSLTEIGEHKFKHAIFDERLMICMPQTVLLGSLMEKHTVDHWLLTALEGTIFGRCHHASQWSIIESTGVTFIAAPFGRVSLS